MSDLLLDTILFLSSVGSNGPAKLALLLTAHRQSIRLHREPGIHKARIARVDSSGDPLSAP